MTKSDTSCDECGSPFVSATSRMQAICPECAHWLYGYPNCQHQIVAGKCVRCGWDGSVSEYVKALKDPARKR